MLNNKIDSLTSFGLNDISDIVSAVEGIKGSTGYDLTDVCSKLYQIDFSLKLIRTRTKYKNEEISS
jgi:hypothetical protein